jgi:hypothetical protein
MSNPVILSEAKDLRGADPSPPMRLRMTIYLFEIVAAANFVVICWLLWPIRAPLMMLPRVLWIFGSGFLTNAAIGIAVRAVVAWRRGQLRSYARVLRSAEWITDTLRLAVVSGLFIAAYGWIKLSVPLLHPRLFDQELWNLDRKLLAGYSPNEFVLTLFSAPAVLRAVDWAYANIFYVSLLIASAFFASSPSRRLRVAFMNSNVLLWLAGAWLYVAVPSLGPAFRFPEVWVPLAAMLDTTQTLQRVLMNNYQNVLAFKRGVYPPVHFLLGIAAFPSLHVAFQMLAFLWMRKMWRGGEVIFGVFVVAILIGSMVTGWHYLIDGIAGIALAWLCYCAAIRLAAKAF